MSGFYGALPTTEGTPLDIADTDEKLKVKHWRKKQGNKQPNFVFWDACNDEKYQSESEIKCRMVWWDENSLKSGRESSNMSKQTS